MPTQAERLADLARAHADLERRVGRLEDEVHGGPSVEWAQSIRGKLHAMQSAMASADKLKQAAEAVASAQREQSRTIEHVRGRRFSRLTQIVLALAAVAAAAAPYVLHFA